MQTKGFILWGTMNIEEYSEASNTRDIKRKGVRFSYVYYDYLQGVNSFKARSSLLPPRLSQQVALPIAIAIAAASVTVLRRRMCLCFMRMSLVRQV